MSFSLTISFAKLLSSFFEHNYIIFCQFLSSLERLNLSMIRLKGVVSHTLLIYIGLAFPIGVSFDLICVKPHVDFILHNPLFLPLRHLLQPLRTLLLINY